MSSTPEYSLCEAHLFDYSDTLIEVVKDVHFVESGELMCEAEYFMRNKKVKSVCFFGKRTGDYLGGYECRDQFYGLIYIRKTVIK